MLNRGLVQVAALVATFLVAAFLVLATGCANTKVYTSHKSLVKDEAQPHAKVYFIREWQQRSRGVADNNVTIEVAGENLLELGEGEYSLMRLTPQKTFIVTHSQAFVTSKPNPTRVTRAQEFTFDAGETYYILAKLNQEEFRGIYFTTEAINLDQAKNAAVKLKPSGSLAEDNPLYVAPRIRREVSIDY